MWRHHGEEYGLELSADRLNRYKGRATAGYGGSLPADLSPEQAQAERDKYAMALQFLEQNRNVTNFPFFRATSAAEARPATVEARKTLWKAEQARKLGDRLNATRLYLDGLKKWKEVILGDRNFHRPPHSDRIEEQTYEYELAYLRMLVQDDQAVRERANEVVDPARGVIPFLPYPYPETLRQSQLAANERIQDSTPAFLRLRPHPLSARAHASEVAANEAAERRRAAAPAFVRPFLPDPFPYAEAEPPTQTPQWGKDDQEEIKWFVAERDFSPFAGLMNTNDDRRGTPWIQKDVKESVRLSQGLQRKVNNPPPGSRACPCSRNAVIANEPDRSRHPGPSR